MFILNVMQQRNNKAKKKMRGKKNLIACIQNTWSHYRTSTYPPFILRSYKNFRVPKFQKSAVKMYYTCFCIYLTWKPLSCLSWSFSRPLGMFYLEKNEVASPKCLWLVLLGNCVKTSLMKGIDSFYLILVFPRKQP
jgi:hypothetical protein